MKELNDIIEKLSYESYVLGRQGKQEASWRKKCAAELARKEWKKFNKQHRRIWMRRRKQQNPPEDSQLKML